MKKFLGLVIILVALILGGYYGMGLITERTLKKDINIINQSNGINVELKQYNRGWFTSNASLQWTIHVAERVVKDQNGQTTTIPPQDYTIDMPLTIYHGPMIFANGKVQFGLGYAHTDLIMPKQYEDQFNAAFTSASTKPHLDLSVFVNYLDNSRLRINLPTFKLIAKDNKGQFEWLGLTNDLTVSSDISDVSGDLLLKGIVFTKENTQTTVGEITSNYDLHQTPEKLYTGKANLSFPSLIIKQDNQEIFELDQLKAHTSSDVTAGLFNTYFDTSLDKIVTPGKTYGPGVLKMSLKNLDAQALGRINAQMNTMQGDSDQQRQQAIMSLLPELPKLLGQGPEFKISELKFVMPEGAIQANLELSLPKGEFNNPFEMIQKLKGESKIKIPAVIVKDVVKESIKQKLTTQQSGNLSQAIVSQIQQNNQKKGQQDNQPQQQGQTTPTQKAKSEQPQASQQAPAQPSSQPAPDLEQQATMQTNEKLSALVKSGVITAEDNSYSIELKLVNGQLTVNGQPFSSAMLEF